MKKKYHIFVIMIMLLSLMMCTGVSAATKNADKKEPGKKLLRVSAMFTKTVNTLKSLEDHQ